MSNTKYWLCCGSTDSYHGPERVGQCTEARAGNPDRCRFGTKEDHKEYLNADTAKDKATNAELVRLLGLAWGAIQEAGYEDHSFDLRDKIEKYID